MNRCLITYEKCDVDYSAKGLRRLSPQLKTLKTLPFSQEKLVQESTLRMTKMSIQGVQPKLSAVLKVSKGCFEIVDSKGKFIIKPQNPSFPELPENEAITMSMAAVSGIETPIHGLIRCEDKRLTYFIKRFDRIGRKDKLAVEDFAQLSGKSRETKYQFSMEKLIEILDYCTFPKVERSKFLRRCLFNWLTGNEDMHLKNYSLITRNGKVELAPAYDFLNSSIVYRFLGKPWSEIEESALPLAGKKRKFDAKLWLNYFAKERLNLPERQITKIVNELLNKIPEWETLIDNSFLSKEMKELYHELLLTRANKLKS